MALGSGIDWVWLSFIQRPDDIAEAKKITRGRAAVMAIRYISREFMPTTTNGSVQPRQPLTSMIQYRAESPRSTQPPL